MVFWVFLVAMVGAFWGPVVIDGGKKHVFFVGVGAVAKSRWSKLQRLLASGPRFLMVRNVP